MLLPFHAPAVSVLRAGRIKRVERARSLLRAVCLICLLLLPSGCGGEPVRVMTFAMDGPPLLLAGEQGGLEPDRPELNAPEPVEAGKAWSGAVEAAGGASTLYEGEMERACMVGNGRFKLVNLNSGEVCEGEVNSGPSGKGRIRGIVSCGQGRFFLFTLSNHGPDQGAGLGRFATGSGEPGDEASLELAIENGPPVLFFYHPWMEESKRRLKDMRKNLAAHLRDSGK